MPKPATRETLDPIIEKVFGYGRVDAPLWFIGLEEACDDENDAAARLPILATFEGTQDVFEAHAKMGHPNPVNTSVWPQMQEIVLAARLREVHVGQRDSDTFLLELLPLPHANKKAWYAELYSALGYKTRDEYVEGILKDRVPLVRTFVKKHDPKVVLRPPQLRGQIPVAEAHRR